jgi:hypothetical protein
MPWVSSTSSSSAAPSDSPIDPSILPELFHLTKPTRSEATAMSAAQKLTGKASYLTFQGTRIYFTKVSPDVDRECADSTDGADYDSSSDMIQPSQIPVKVQMTLQVELKYDLNTTGTAFTQAAYSSGGPYPTVLGLNAGTVMGHGNFDITKFSADVPIDDTVTATATLLQNGVFTPGS